MERRDVISIDDLSRDEIFEIFSIADELGKIHSERRRVDFLKDKILATLFYEPSTRTRLSFETAMHRLGGAVIGFPDMNVSSSAAKGETLADTARVVSEYADVIVIRHPWDGSVRVAADNATVPVINAGDGSHEHPTQTLCDLYTLRKESGGITGLTVLLCGDLKHGRTVHSLALALARFGAHLVLKPARGLDLPAELLRKLAIKYGQKFERVQGFELGNGDLHNVDAVYVTPNDQHALPFRGEELRVEINAGSATRVSRVDVVYVTRQQKERLTRDLYSKDYPRLDADVLKKKKYEKAIVMHPLPRIDEIPQELDSHPQSKYFKQVEYGVWVRMALLHFLLRQPASTTSVVGPGSQREIPHLYEERHKEVGLICLDENCITRHDPSVRRKFYVLTRERTYTSHVLILECYYCASEMQVTIVGNAKSKKYCVYDASMEEFVGSWLADDTLQVFGSEEEARRAGFSPYASGPQRRILGADAVDKAIRNLAQEIVRGIPNLEDLCLVGLKNRGDLIAKRIANIISQESGVTVPVGPLDVLPFRDDVHVTPDTLDSFAFPIDDKIVVIVDDVLYSGRTTRAAMKAIMSGLQKGRPREVKVAVLIDRGHREVPVEPTFVGKSLPTNKSERVEVHLKEPPGKDEVVMFKIIADEDQDRRLPRVEDRG